MISPANSDATWRIAAKHSLTFRRHNGELPFVVEDKEGEDLAATWYARVGARGLVVALGREGTLNPYGYARQMERVERLNIVTRGFLAHFGITARAHQTETKPWTREHIAEYPHPTDFIKAWDRFRHKFQEAHPGRSLPIFELSPDFVYTAEQYAEARARGVFLMSEGDFHDLIAHIPVQTLLSPEVDSAHQRRVARDYAAAQDARAAGNTDLADIIMGTMMRDSDLILSTPGIAGEWLGEGVQDVLETRHEQRNPYEILCSVSAEEAERLAAADRVHREIVVGYFAGHVLGQS